MVIEKVRVVLNIGHTFYGGHETLLGYWLGFLIKYEFFPLFTTNRVYALV